MKHRTYGILILLVSLTTEPADAVSQIRRSVMGSGAVGGTSASHAIRSTAGQGIVARVSGAGHEVGSGFWRASTPLLDLPPAEVFPISYRLGTCSPNPFASHTTLRLDVPQPGGDVAVRIYDPGGRLVRTLVAERLEPGFRTVSWDGRDDFGRRTAMGMYVCAMNAPGYRETRKLVFTGPRGGSR